MASVLNFDNSLHMPFLLGCRRGCWMPRVGVRHAAVSPRLEQRALLAAELSPVDVYFLHGFSMIYT